MPEIKTRKTTASVSAFLNAIGDEGRRKDAKALAALMRKATGAKAAMWGDAIVGYGAMTYAGSKGRTVDWFPVGFSPRKAALVVYLMGGLTRHATLLKGLGRHKVGGGCLYLTSLEDVDLAVLGDLVARSYASSTEVTERQAPTKRRRR